MKIKRKNSRMAVRVATLVLGLGLAGAGIASCIGHVMAATTRTEPVKKRSTLNSTYEANKSSGFSAEYSRGIIYRNKDMTYLDPDNSHPWSAVPSAKAAKFKCSGTKQTDKTTGKKKLTDANYVCGTNNTIQDDVYVTFKNAAILNNEWYDIREYDAIMKSGNNADPNGAYWAINLNTGGMASDQGSVKDKNTPVVIVRRLKFIKNGDTTGTAVKDFKGIMSFGDFDWGEGVTLQWGLSGKSYIDLPTPFKEVTSKSWVMSGKNVKVGDGIDGEYLLWSEVNSSKDYIQIAYKIPVLNRGMKTRTSANTVTYSLSGNLPDGFNEKEVDVVARYGNYKTKTLNLPEGYAFTGWHTNSNYTGASVENWKFNGNITLYGRIDAPAAEETATINTEITNGEITPSKTDVPAGGSRSWTVGYNCNTGYKLSTVTIDKENNGGTELDITEHPSSYTFESVEANSTHSVTVMCIEGAVETEAEEDDENDEDTIDIITSIENGVITESKEDLEEGTNYKVEYSCSEGYTLKSLVVDDEELDVEEYPESYTFENLTTAHAISAVCSNGEEESEEEGEAEVKTPNTGLIGSSSFGSDSTTGGSINVVAILISSLVAIAGIALVIRFVKYSSAISFKK